MKITKYFCVQYIYLAMRSYYFMPFNLAPTLEFDALNCYSLL